MKPLSTLYRILKISYGCRGAASNVVGERFPEFSHSRMLAGLIKNKLSTAMLCRLAAGLKGSGFRVFHSELVNKSFDVPLH